VNPFPDLRRRIPFTASVTYRSPGAGLGPAEIVASPMVPLLFPEPGSFNPAGGGRRLHAV
jgi:hypothetical protein